MESTMIEMPPVCSGAGVVKSGSREGPEIQ